MVEAQPTLVLSPVQYRICVTGGFITFADESGDPAYELLPAARIAKVFSGLRFSHVTFLKMRNSVTAGHSATGGDSQVRIRSLVLSHVIKPALDSFNGHPIAIIECVDEQQLLLAADGEGLLFELLEAVLQFVKDMPGVKLDIAQSMFCSQRVEWRGLVADKPVGPWRLADTQVRAFRSMPVPPPTRFDLRALLRALRYYSWMLADQESYAAHIALLSQLDAPAVDVPAFWTAEHTAALRAAIAALTGSSWLLPYDPTSELLISATANSTGCNAAFSQCQRRDGDSFSSSAPAVSPSAAAGAAATSAVARSIASFSRTWHEPSVRDWSPLRMTAQAHYWAVCKLAAEHFCDARRLVMQVDRSTQLALSGSADERVKKWLAAVAAAGAVMRIPGAPPPVEAGAGGSDATSGGAGAGWSSGPAVGGAGASSAAVGGAAASRLPPRISVRLSSVEHIAMEKTVFMKWARPKIDTAWTFLPVRPNWWSAEGHSWGTHTSKMNFVKLGAEGRPDPRAVSAAVTQMLNYASTSRQLPLGKDLLSSEVQRFFSSHIDEWAKRHPHIVKDYPTLEGAGLNPKWSVRKDVVAVIAGMVLFVHEHGLTLEDAFASDLVTWSVPAKPTASDIETAARGISRGLRDCLRCVRHDHVTRRDVHIAMVERAFLSLPPPLERAVRARAGLEEPFVACEAGATRAQYVSYDSVTLARLQDIIREEAVRLYSGDGAGAAGAATGGASRISRASSGSEVSAAAASSGSAATPAAAPAAAAAPRASAGLVRFANPALNGPPCVFCMGDHTSDACPRVKNGRVVDEEPASESAKSGSSSAACGSSTPSPSAPSVSGSASAAASASGGKCPKGISCVKIGCPLKHPAVTELD